VNLYNNVMPK